MANKKKIYNYTEEDYCDYHENSGFFDCPTCGQEHWVEMPDDGQENEFSCTCGTEGVIRWSIPEDWNGNPFAL